MRILSIHAENFRQHADSFVEFPPEGIVGIIGDNEAGKSSLLEAVVWAIFGTDATRGTKDGLRWHGAPARRTASATVRFEVGGRTYRVERGESTARLVDETSGQVLVEGTAPVNAHAPRLLGMSHREFAASYLVLQKDLTRIADMGPTERTTFVRQVMGVGRIDDALKAVRKRKGELARERAGIEEGLGRREPLEEQLQAAEARLAEAREEHAARERLAAAAEATRREADEALQAAEAAKEAHDVQLRAAENAENALKAAELDIETLTNRAQQQEEAVARLTEAEPRLERIPDLREERDQLMEARAAAGERERLTVQVATTRHQLEGPGRLEERIRDAERQVGVFDPEELKAAQARAGEADAKLDRLRSEREAQRARKLAEAAAALKEADRHDRRARAIREAGENGACPTCARALGAQFAAVLEEIVALANRARDGAEDCRIDAAGELASPSDDEIQAEIDRDEAESNVERLLQLQADAILAGRQLNDFRQQRAKLRGELEAAEKRLAGLPEAGASAERLTAVDAELRELEALNASLAGDRGLASQIDETMSSLAARETMRDTAARALAAARAAIEETAFDPERHRTLATAAEEARAAHEGARIALARAEEARTGAWERYEAAEAALEAYDGRAGRLGEVTEELRAYEVADTRLGEFRTAVAGSIRPEMEEYMSGYVHLLTDGRHEAVTLTEDFTAVLHESGVASEVVSGGTQDIVALAMRLAISQMIAERAGHPLSLLVLDEPFGSLDETRRGTFMALLRRLQGTFRQVLVISHVAETRDMVDHAIVLEFDEATRRSRVVGAPAASEAA